MNFDRKDFSNEQLLDLYSRILAKKGEEKVNVLYSRSLYGTDKLNMSEKYDFKF